MVQHIEYQTDEVLCEKCKTDTKYFSIIIDRYTPKLTRYIKRRSIARSEDIDDLLQNIFIKVYRNINEYDSSLLFSSWIYRIAYNEMIDWYRKQKIRSTVSLDDEDQAFVQKLFSDDNHTDRFTRQENIQVVSKALETLDEKYKEILFLRFFEEKSYEEISDIIKIPSGTVAIRISRAKENLKKALTLYETNT